MFNIVSAYRYNKFLKTINEVYMMLFVRFGGTWTKKDSVENVYLQFFDVFLGSGSGVRPDPDSDSQKKVGSGSRRKNLLFSPGRRPGKHSGSDADGPLPPGTAGARRDRVRPHHQDPQARNRPPPLSVTWFVNITLLFKLAWGRRVWTGLRSLRTGCCCASCHGCIGWPSSCSRWDRSTAVVSAGTAA